MWKYIDDRVSYLRTIAIVRVREKLNFTQKISFILSIPFIIYCDLPGHIYQNTEWVFLMNVHYAVHRWFRPLTDSVPFATWFKWSLRDPTKTKSLSRSLALKLCNQCVQCNSTVHFGLLEFILLPYHDDTSHKYNNPHTNMAISVTHIDIGADRSIDRSIKRIVGFRLLSLLKSTSDRQWQRKKHMHYHRKRTKQINIRGINRMTVVDSVSLLFLFGWCGFGIPIGRHQKHSMNPSE